MTHYIGDPSCSCCAGPLGVITWTNDKVIVCWLCLTNPATSAWMREHKVRWYFLRDGSAHRETAVSSWARLESRSGVWGDG